MAFKHRYGDGWYKNAAGLWVQAEPISAALVAAASTGQAVTKKADGTLELTTISGGGGSGAGMEQALLATPTDASYNSSMSDHFPGASLDAKWIAFNATGLTSSVSASCLMLDSSTATKKGYTQAVPAANGHFTILTRVTTHVFTGFHAAGLFLYESGTGKRMRVDIENNTGTQCGAAKDTSADAFSASIGSLVSQVPVSAPVWLALTYDGTNYGFYWSPSGVRGTYESFGTVAKAGYFTTAATDWGVFVNAFGNNRVRAAFDVVWFFDAALTL